MQIYFFSMARFDERQWLSVFNLTKSDTIRRLLPFLIGIAAYTAVIVWIEELCLKPDSEHHLRNLTLMHGLLSFAISMLLVFRTNSAYDRWWEGRKLWGSLINNSRNLAIKLNTFLPQDKNDERKQFARLIPMFAMYLKRHLQSDIVRLELDEHLHPELPAMNTQKHVPNQIVSAMWLRIHHLYKNNDISGDQLIVLNAEMQSFLDICGACERIKNTPIPSSYSSFIKKFILIYVATLPLGYVFSLSWFAIPVVTFIFYVLASLELIAEEIEEPFGFDENDLPLQRMAMNIKQSVEEIL